MDLINGALDVASNPRHSKWVSRTLLAADAILCILIVAKIPCTTLTVKTLSQQARLD